MTQMVIIQSEPGLWTVGHYKPDGKFEPLTDWRSVDDARRELRFLNGGTS